MHDTTTSRYRLCLALLSLTCLLTTARANASLLSFTTNQSQYTPGVNNQGYWANRDLPCCTVMDTNDNYFTGEADFGLTTGFAELRSFFTFDLRSMAAPVTGASLTVYSGVFGTDSFTEVLELFDVSTEAAILNFNDRVNDAIFEDLGSGNSYGRFRLFRATDSMVDITLELNDAALADINAAAGGFFSIGGKIRTISQTGSEYVFGQTGGPNRRPAELTLSVAAVPGPGVMSLTALALLLIWARCRPERATSPTRATPSR